MGVSFLFILLLLSVKMNNMDIYENIEKIPLLLAGFSFGASFVAMFA